MQVPTKFSAQDSFKREIYEGKSKKKKLKDEKDNNYETHNDFIDYEIVIETLTHNKDFGLITGVSSILITFLVKGSSNTLYFDIIINFFM